MSFDFTSAYARLSWANKQIEELEAQLPIFQGQNPYSVALDEHPQAPKEPGHAHLVVRVNEPTATEITTEISLRVGDVIHSLRAVLDHIAWAVVPNPGQNTAYPIWRQKRNPTSAEYESLVGRKIQGAGSDIEEVFRSCEPYFGGNDQDLRIIDYLDIVDKHRLLLVVFSSYDVIEINPDGLASESGASLENLFGTSHIRNIPPVPLSDLPLKDGYVLWSGPLDSINQKQPRIFPQVVFGEPLILEGHYVVPTLATLAQSVNDVIDQFARLT